MAFSSPFVLERQIKISFQEAKPPFNLEPLWYRVLSSKWTEAAGGELMGWEAATAK